MFQLSSTIFCVNGGVKRRITPFQHAQHRKNDNPAVLMKFALSPYVCVILKFKSDSAKQLVASVKKVELRNHFFSFFKVLRLSLDFLVLLEEFDVCTLHETLFSSTDATQTTTSKSFLCKTCQIILLRNISTTTIE